MEEKAVEVAGATGAPEASPCGLGLLGLAPTTRSFVPGQRVAGQRPPQPALDS